MKIACHLVLYIINTCENKILRTHIIISKIHNDTTRTTFTRLFIPVLFKTKWSKPSTCTSDNSLVQVCVNNTLSWFWNTDFISGVCNLFTRLVASPWPFSKVHLSGTFWSSSYWFESRAVWTLGGGALFVCLPVWGEPSLDGPVVIGLLLALLTDCWLFITSGKICSLLRVLLTLVSMVQRIASVSVPSRRNEKHVRAPHCCVCLGWVGTQHICSVRLYTL